MSRLRHPFKSLESRLIWKFGPRGLCLMILGFMWSLLGSAFLLNPMPRFAKPSSGGILDFLDKGAGIFIFSSMWLIGGVCALVVAFQRPISCKDDIGFNGLCLPPFLWGAGYWWSFIVNTLSAGEYGRPGAYFAGMVYWTFAILLMFLARHLNDHPDGPCARRRAGQRGSLPQ